MTTSVAPRLSAEHVHGPIEFAGAGRLGPELDALEEQREPQVVASGVEITAHVAAEQR
jgi:hypothetical protein